MGVEASLTVFVVDDNAQNRELIGEFLDELGCEIRQFASGQEMLDSIPGVVPDLVVLDVMMPRMSGFQVCERLQADAATADVPVLMLTALNETADVERAVEVGASDFLIKPVQRQELISRVRAHVGVRRLQQRVNEVVQQLRGAFDAA